MRSKHFGLFEIFIFLLFKLEFSCLLFSIIVRFIKTVTKSAFNLFENLLSKLKTDLVSILINLIVVEKKEETNPNLANNIQVSNNPKCLLIQKKGQKISRNEKCEATGKKFKQCCGALK